jgi:hypothetical protein
MIAKQTVVVKDARGRFRRVVADQPIPADLVDAYKEETGEKDDKETRVDAAKRQSGPEQDKAQRSAQRTK